MTIKPFRLILASSLAILVFATWIAPPPSAAQGQPSAAMKDDIEQLAIDLKVGMDRSNLTPQQKEQVRADVKQLREARKNHEPLKGMEAARRIKSMVDSGFQPGDKQRIQADMQAIREAREMGRPN